MSAARHKVAGDLLPDGLAALDRRTHRRRAPEQRRGDPPEQVTALVLEARARACSAASSHASAAASARASSHCCQPRSRSALHCPCSSPAARNTGSTSSTTADASAAALGAPRLMPSICCWTSACDRASSSPARAAGGHGLGRARARRRADGPPRSAWRPGRVAAPSAGRHPPASAPRPAPADLPRPGGRFAAAPAGRPTRAARPRARRARRRRRRRRAELARGSGTPAPGGSRRSPRIRRRGPPALLEPVREALVQLGARGLGKRAVGGVADEDVPEAEGVVVAEAARSGRIRSRRTSSLRRAVHHGPERRRARARASTRGGTAALDRARA